MPKRPHYAAFTLVELMVVIGIIAVLLSLLLPALNRAREQAKSVQCASNIRSILQACESYALESNDVMPIPSLYGETITSGQPFIFSGPSAGIVDFKLGTLARYLGSSVQARRNVMNCPSDTEDIRLISTGGGNVFVGPRNFSYSFNGYLRGPSPTVNWKLGAYSSIRLPGIVHPAQKVLVFEEQWPNDLTCFIPAYDKDDVPGLRHLGRCNMGFADGHVDSYYPIDFGVFENGTTVSYPNHALTDQFCNLIVP